VAEFVNKIGLPILYTVIIMLFFQFQAIIFVWLERKVSGRIQDRLGPTRVGGKFGWLQTIADGVKLLLKEDLIPRDADRAMFRVSPYIVLCGAFAAFIVIPFTFQWAAQSMNVAVFFMLAVMSVEVFGVIMAGYASGSKWALFGGMREAAQVVSYEVPMAMNIVPAVMASGTMNLNEVGLMQAGGIQDWMCFHDPFTFFAAIMYIVCATASVKRAPFDLAEAESELVAGFHTEYSGFRWLIFFMAEYASMLAVAWIATLMFWGGWSGPLPVTQWLGWWHPNEAGELVPNLPAKILGLLNFIAKGYTLIVVMMWVRWTLPRIRIDQVMKTCLKYLLPITCFLLLGAAAWPLFVRTRLGGQIGGAAAALLLAIIVIIAIVSTPKSAAQGRREIVYK
jgi:NADH-quinone oxidoreductase subunit H